MTPEELRNINQNWKSDYIEKLMITRKEKLKLLSRIKDEFLGYKDLEKFVFLLDHMIELSLCNDEEVINLLDSMGVDKIVTKWFVNVESVFDQLDRFYEKSVYLYPYERIWEHYKGYIHVFFAKQLLVQFNIDLVKGLNQLSKKEKDSTFNQYEQELMDELKKLDDMAKQKKLGLRVLIKGDNFSYTIKKVYNKPLKILFYNFYVIFKEDNLAAPIKKDITKFYCDFYDLMKILLRDKTILNDKEVSESWLNYSSLKLFKVKRVKSLLKLKGYGTYK
jgi:hypothetical protein